MKKKILIFILLFITLRVFAIDEKYLLDYLYENNSAYYVDVKYNNKKYYDKVLLYDDVYLVIISTTKNEPRSFSLYVTNGKDYASDFVAPGYKTSDKQKYKYKDFDFYIADFDFDGYQDIIYIVYGSVWDTIIESYSFKNEGKNLFTISNVGDYKPLEFKFSWLEYAIVNEKRGFLIKYVDDVFLSDNKDYKFLGKTNNSSFFYWSPSEQKYILDESVTQDQIKNAIIPDDYFAYNGLKFSKLDSKLSLSDLEGLDKAQLRLMRNAVYARHGRTFKSIDLQSLWECYTWYKKNPNYTDDLLTETDKYNIKLIQEYEAKLR